MYYREKRGKRDFGAISLGRSQSGGYLGTLERKIPTNGLS